METYTTAQITEAQKRIREIDKTLNELKPLLNKEFQIPVDQRVCTFGTRESIDNAWIEKQIAKLNSERKGLEKIVGLAK